MRPLSRTSGSLLALTGALLWPFAADPASAQQRDSVTPAQVLAAVEHFQEELDLLREALDRPQEDRPMIQVRDVHPRAVFFQAQTLFRKTDQLSFERIRQRAPLPEPPARETGPADVLAVVGSALVRLRRVKEGLGIREEVEEPRAKEEASSADVFQAIVQANRQLNLLLESEFEPSEVYQQVTLAIGYAARMLEPFPDAPTIVDPPPQTGMREPNDVYRRLAGCLERIRRTADSIGLQLVRLETSSEELARVTPSDVYDIASLVVSELSYLHRALGDLGPPPGTYYPGLRSPTDVYRRVGILEAQLIELEARVQNASNDHRHGPTGS